MKKIYITGIAGTGKSAVAKILKKRGFSIIDVDHVQNLCSWINKKNKEKVVNLNPDNKFIDEHDYICDISMLENLMKNFDSHIFVFGSVGDNCELIPLFDTLILLQCEPETLIHRLQNRNTNPFGKKVEVQNRMLEWKKIFDQLMLQSGAIPISTEEDIEVVADKIINTL